MKKTNKTLKEKNYTSHISHHTSSNHRGITLIALVITIIVMLILVAVTINLSINGGLFGFAGKAASETKTAIENEKGLGNIPSNLSTDELITLLTTNKEEDLKKLRLYFTGSTEPNGPGVLRLDLAGIETDFRDNKVITDASKSITRVRLHTLVDYDVIKYHNNYYKVYREKKYTKVEACSDSETFPYKIMENGTFMKVIDDATYYEYNDKIYKVTQSGAVEATEAEAAEAKKVTITYGKDENKQTIIFTPTKGQTWIDWANSAGDDIDLSDIPIQEGLTLKGLIIQQNGTADKKISINISFDNYYILTKVGDGIVMGSDVAAEKASDEILAGCTYFFELHSQPFDPTPVIVQ